MIYREAGQVKTSYVADQAIFPIAQDRWGMLAMLVFAFVIVPVFFNQYWLGPIMTQFLIFSLAALGLNLLTGYAGQLSLGAAAFMAVGGFAAFNLTIRIPEIPLVVDFLIGGLFAALAGVIFGLPSLRIKGFYLAVATLAAQFFFVWLFDTVEWFVNYDSAGVASAPERTLLGPVAEAGGILELLAPINVVISGPRASPEAKYLVTLTFVAVLALAAKNIVRSAAGRSWMAIRDMDVAAEVIGIPMLRTKLMAFAVSSFYCGVAGALYAFAYAGNVEAEAYDLARSFQILFMVIIGGLGSILGSFLGAAFIVLLPITLSVLSGLLSEGPMLSDLKSNLEFMIFGAAIVLFLIVEPHGLARLWQIGKEKLRLWPFAH